MLALGVVPPGVVALGLLLGGLASLSAMGLVLIYRAHRFLNLAHSSLGLVPAVLVAQLVSGAGWSFWLAAPTGLASGAALGIASERLLVGRFGDAPRLVLTVASLGLAYVLVSGQAALRFAFGGSPFLYVPVGIAVEVFPVRFGGAHLLALAAVPLALGSLAVFLRVTRYGVAVRAVAQNADRARSLGIRARSTSMVVWAVAGALAAGGGILSAPILGLSLQTGPGIAVLLLALAPAVVAGMRSLPGTVAASLAVGVGYQAVLWLTPRAAWADVALLAVVLAAFGLRVTGSRRDQEAADVSSWGTYAAVRPLPAAVSERRLVRHGSRVGFAAVVVAAGAVAVSLGPSAAQRFGAAGVFALTALSLAVVMGFCGQPSFGQWGFTGAGAAAATLAVPHAGVPAALVLAALCGSAAAVAVGLPALRAGRFAYAASTLAFGVAVHSLYAAWPAIRPMEPLAAWVGGVSLAESRRVAVLVVASVGAGLLLVVALRGRRLGRAMLAVRDNESAAAAHGLDVTAVKLSAYAISGALAGLAGGLYLLNQRVVLPDSFAPERSLLVVAMLVVGGIGSPSGAVAGAMLVAGAFLFLQGAWQSLGTAAGVLVVLALLPGGVAGLTRTVRDAVTRRVADAGLTAVGETRP